jgi:hypothetical protein
MMESEWLACTNPILMLEYLRGKASDRKLRLFGLACCRRIPGPFFDVAALAVLLTAERFADGTATRKGLSAAIRRAMDAEEERIGGAVQTTHWWQPISAALGSSETVRWLAESVVQRVHALNNDRKAVIRAAAGDELRAARESWAKAEAAANKERITQCHLLRDIVPYQATKCDTNLLTSEVATLARVAYEERALPSGELDTARLAVLADALEEAGCTDADILTHLRGPGPHVRGCWVLDLLLGKDDINHPTPS